MMTDNEIIKALECCTNNSRSCKDCLYEFSHTENKWCDEVLLEDAFALITRQKAEIEKLKGILANEREGIIQLNDRIDEYIAEAIKEFAERVKKECLAIPQCHFNYLGVEYSIDNLVKEVVGDV